MTLEQAIAQIRMIQEYIKQTQTGHQDLNKSLDGLIDVLKKSEFSSEFPDEIRDEAEFDEDEEE